ncbi:hypothetical protein Z043_114217, partial [Scleropages formosus]
EAAHRLNLFYLANDVIQNCKRKNAIIYRSTFAEVLPEAALLVKDAKVRKSVERIFTIWEERNVYPEELISELKASLVKKEPPSVPVNAKAALKSKIVAEFAPQTFIEQLSGYKHSVEEAELKEKQLSALRVDVCSTEALKRLKDKAGGKKFSKDFEEGSGKLQEFVSFLEQQVKGGPHLLEALSNADVFYEMQYKEVKIVANAYKTFANRVSNLKRKLDALKTTLPDPEDSPIPSPSEDAPSPTGSESPFHGMGVGGSKADTSNMDIDGRAMDGGDTPSPLSTPSGSQGPVHGHGEGDNRDVEDMELSEGEEAESANIIVEERREKPVPTPVSKPTPAAVQPLRVSEESSSKKPAPLTAPTPSTPGTPATPLPVNLANVDLGKISSILSSLTSVMKSTGVSPVSRPSPGTPTTPSAQGSVVKPPTPSPGGPSAANPLASILSRVDITPEGILSALSKTQAQSGGLQGLSSLLHTVAGNSSVGASNAGKDRTPNPAPSEPIRGPNYGSPEGTTSSSVVPAGKSSTMPTTPKPKPPLGNNYKQELDRESEREPSAVSSSSPTSLESKIHKFLQGNPGFSAINLNIPILGSGQGGSSDSPLLGSENVDGTPVRDETGGTPTQDEIMDKPGSESLALLTDSSSLGPVKKLPSAGHDLSPTAYRSDSWDVSISPQAVFGQVEENDGDYRSSHYPGFGPDKVSKSILKMKGEELKRRMTASKSGSCSTSSSTIQDSKPGHTKARKDSQSTGPGGNSLSKASFYESGGEKRVTPAKESHPVSATERLKNAGSRKVGSSVEGGMVEGKEEAEGIKEKALGNTSPVSESESSHYHRIETLVSSSPPPPIPQPPPPPIPQPPHPPRDFLSPPSAVMVGGVLVPVDRPLPFPPSRPDGGERGGANSSSSNTGSTSLSGAGNPSNPHCPPPLMSSVLGDPPPFKETARPGAVKENFSLSHAPPLHRPASGPPPPLLGRVQDGPSPPPSSSASSAPPSPSGDPPSLLTQNRHPTPSVQQSQRPPGSPPSQSRNHRRPSSPVSLMRLPMPGPRPHIRPPNPHTQPAPLPQRQFLRSRPLHPHTLRHPPFEREPLFHGGKRPGPPFSGGAGGGPFYPPKRPFLPPRY